MPTQSEFLEFLWEQRINDWMQEDWISEEIDRSERRPNDPFADTGIVLKRLLELGATPREISLLARSVAYSSAFATLFALEGNPGVDTLVGIHESILSADPSGMEGRPGSAPAKREGEL